MAPLAMVGPLQALNVQPLSQVQITPP